MAKKEVPKPIRDYFAQYGREGGKIRKAKMTPEERTESARHAARARWKNKGKTVNKRKKNGK
jgi:hypothetical protein